MTTSASKRGIWVMWVFTVNFLFLLPVWHFKHFLKVRIQWGRGGALTISSNFNFDELPSVNMVPNIFYCDKHYNFGLHQGPEYTKGVSCG